MLITLAIIIQCKQDEQAEVNRIKNNILLMYIIWILSRKYILPFLCWQNSKCSAAPVWFRCWKIHLISIIYINATTDSMPHLAQQFQAPYIDLPPSCLTMAKHPATKIEYQRNSSLGYCINLVYFTHQSSNIYIYTHIYIYIYMCILWTQRLDLV